MSEHDSGRRDLLNWVFLAGGSLLAPAFAAPSRRQAPQEEEVSPDEDLMREHGLLKRILLVYRNYMHRIAAKQEFPPDPLVHSARMIRSFIESYHEKLEEDYLFPRFRKAGQLVELVDVLERQHKAGRVVTDRILAVMTSGEWKNPTRRAELNSSLEAFVRMYEPHEAREDTVLFPAFRKIVSPHEYDALGEDFEKKEHQLFGQEGFEKNVAEIASIEKALGIYDLAQFTPKV